MTSRSHYCFAALLIVAASSAAVAQDVPADSSAVVPCNELTELNSVSFAVGSAELDDEAERRLRENTELLIACPATAASVSGWTSSGCNGRWSRAELFPSLANERATAVYDYYLGAGVRQEQVVVAFPSSDDHFGGGPKECEPRNDRRGWRADTIILQTPALSGVQAEALNAIVCDALERTPSIPVAPIPGSERAVRPTPLGLERIAESAHLLRRCSSLRVGLCHPVGKGPVFVRSPMFRLGISFDRMVELPDELDACVRARRDQPDDVHMVVSGRF